MRAGTRWGADPMPDVVRFGGQTVQAIDTKRPCVVPTRCVARSDLCRNRPCFADLCAQWRMIERAHKLSIILRIVAPQRGLNDQLKRWRTSCGKCFVAEIDEKPPAVGGLEAIIPSAFLHPGVLW